MLELEPILWSALVGWGVGESRAEISKLPLAYPNGRQTSWPDVVRQFCELHSSATAGEPYLVGRFLSFCVSNGLLTGREELAALTREDQALGPEEDWPGWPDDRPRPRLVSPRRESERGPA